ncbi:MAG: hypothetical protein HC825_11300, partial [Oscillatoriales cyanobacterium RM1_1_9]|nr:hypothetical protein [Oscillatoriales cyanobacterium RM1_1_9]
MLGLILTIGINFYSISQAQILFSIPAGFHLRQAAPGVQLYSDSRGNYVQVIHLNQGASIRFLFGVQHQGNSEAAYGGQSPSFQPQSLKSYWGQLFQLDQIRS